MQTWHFRSRSVPFALLIYCLISFGILIPWLGFYWDDWPSIFYLHVLGPKGFIQAFSVDRPTLGWLFMATSAIFGQSTLAWQIFGLAARWLSSLALWWTLRELWPQQPRQAAWTALLFAAYPGFLQQYIAVTYSHTWLVLAAFFVSLGTMLWAIRDSKRFWPLMAISWVLSAFCMFTDEYFFGLELLRPVFLWLAFKAKPDSPVSRLRQTAVRWLPYVAIIAVFLLWRLILHESPRGQVQIFDKLRDAPIATSQELLENVLQDSFDSSLRAWGQVLDIPRWTQGGRGPALLYAGIVVIVVVSASIYLWRLRFADQPGTPTEPTSRWALSAILIGLLGLLVGGIPFWATNLPIDLRFPWDRFTLAMNLGASLLIAGLLDGLVRHRTANFIILAALLGLAAGMHVQLANIYRREWNSQKAFFWQLVWRAPALKPGTMILSAELPFTYYSDNSLTAPLNWIYAPEQSSPQLPYLFYNIESRLGGKLSGFQKGQNIYEPYRAMYFSGSTSQAIAIYYGPPGCVKVVDPATDARTPQKPLYFSQVLSLSDLSLILPEADPPAHPPAQYFGSEPEHNWCYYFEKADIARHAGDWQEVVRLGKQAFSLNTRLYEVNATELLPYIEGYAQTGDWQRARELTNEAQRLTFRMQRILCDTWGRIEKQAALTEEGQQTVEQVRLSLKCAP
jgi:hypothetical protein